MAWDRSVSTVHPSDVGVQRLALVIEISTPRGSSVVPLHALRTNPYSIGSDPKTDSLVIPGFNRTIVLDEYYEILASDTLEYHQRLHCDGDDVAVDSSPVVFRSSDQSVQVIFRQVPRSAP